MTLLTWAAVSSCGETLPPAAKDGYENSPMADDLRDEIIDLLAEAPMRIEAHPYSAIPALPGDSE